MFLRILVDLEEKGEMTKEELRSFVVDLPLNPRDMKIMLDVMTVFGTKERVMNKLADFASRNGEI